EKVGTTFGACHRAVAGASAVADPDGCRVRVKQSPLPPQPNGTFQSREGTAVRLRLLPRPHASRTSARPCRAPGESVRTRNGLLAARRWGAGVPHADFSVSAQSCRTGDKNENSFALRIRKRARAVRTLHAGVCGRLCDRQSEEKSQFEQG